MSERNLIGKVTKLSSDKTIKVLINITKKALALWKVS